MNKFLISLFSLLSLFLLHTGCATSKHKEKLVVIDIGHYVQGNSGTGASGKASDGTRLEETEFWLKNVQYLARKIEKAGHRCTVINRGNPPSGGLASIANQVPINYLGKPDTRDKKGVVIRYSSQYYPQFTGAGMISADYAIKQKADCIIFLHHDSAISGKNIYKSLIFKNEKQGSALADAVAATLNKSVIGSEAGQMPNGGIPCKTRIRKHPAMGGGWLDACDAAGIPAIIVEAALLSTPDHVNWLAKPENARRFAEGVGNGIVLYLK